MFFLMLMVMSAGTMFMLVVMSAGAAVGVFFFYLGHFYLFSSFGVF